MNPRDRTSPDHAVDQLLQSLGQTQPPAGLNRRLLASLEARSAAATPSRPSRLGAFFARNGSAFALPLAALATAAIFCAIHLHPSLSSNAPVHPEAPSYAAASTSPKASAPSLTAATTREVLASEPTRARPPISIRPLAASTTSTDPAYAPSFPAPPAPLTAEEKLLLHMLHRATPVLLAELGAGRPIPNLPPRDADSFFAAFLPGPHPPPDPPPPTPSTDPNPDPAPQPAEISDPSSTLTTTPGDPQ
jgi:hypothetical protein